MKIAKYILLFICCMALYGCTTNNKFIEEKLLEEVVITLKQSKDNGKNYTVDVTKINGDIITGVKHLSLLQEAGWSTGGKNWYNSGCRAFLKKTNKDDLYKLKLMVFAPNTISGLINYEGIVKLNKPIHVKNYRLENIELQQELECNSSKEYLTFKVKKKGDKFTIYLSSDKKLITRVSFVLEREARVYFYHEDLSPMTSSTSWVQSYCTVLLTKNKKNQYHLKLLWSDYKKFAGILSYNHDIELNKLITIKKGYRKKGK